MLSETGQIAKQALVLMLVPINDRWKLPLGYFLVNGLNGLQKSQIVKECLKKVSELDIVVASITFAPSNKTMAKELGCNLDLANPISFFVCEDRKIFVNYDACHVIKLIRNALGELKILNIENSNQQIRSYIEQLHELQEKQGLKTNKQIAASTRGVS